MLRCPTPFRGLVLGLALAAGSVLSVHGKLADLEKQIQALTKRLEELRKTPAETTSSLPDATIPAEWIKALTWRSIGPANMGGRITAISVFEADPTTYWVATASGGLVKTINNGITFEHQFDREATVSIGDVCVAPADRNIVWVGTGENNPRNSVSYGDGVYKSTDGGKTWKNMGLTKTFQIGRVVVHPKNPDIVYVGALGRLYGPSEDRGLYKTTDGGKTWQKILYIDDQTGIIDIQMNPTDPETLLVAAWSRLRDEFDDFLGEPPPPDGIVAYDPVRKYSKNGGIFKTTDGGKTFQHLTKGLPTVATGRIGLDYYRKNPNTVFAILDTEKIGTGLPPLSVIIGVQGEEGTGGLKLNTVSPDSPAARAGLKANDILISLEGKPVPNLKALVEILQPHKAGDKVKAVYQRGTEKKEVEVTLAARPTQTGRGGRGGMRFLNPGFFAEDAEGGVLVTEIDEQGEAAKAGLKIDDLVTAIEGKPVERFFQTLGQLTSAHQAGDKIKLSVKRGEERLRGRTPKGHTPRPNGSQLGGQRENVQDQQGPDGFQTGGVYKSTDGGESWTRVNSLNPRPMYFSQVRVDPTDDNIVYILGVSLYRSKNGGKAFAQEGNRGVHSDQHALWIDPRDGRHMIIGCDGGFYQTYDRAEHWDHLNHLALGQFYHVAVDPRPVYRALGGLQDNGSWAGPTRTLRPGGPINEDWLTIGGGDGFVCRVDPRDPDLVYSESQGGAIQRRHLKTGERAMLRPKRVPGRAAYRFNWNTPFILSSHNPSIFYSAGQYRIISPEITRTSHGSATALAESPRNPDLLYVGTDDGALWATRDGGGHWTDIRANVKLPGPRWVATIEPSRYVDGRAYVAFDAHRSNDDEPYVYVTEDYGQTWKSIRGNLPVGSARVCREDIQNPDLLYVGAEFAAWVSANRGVSWTKLNNNLPTVAIHEFAQHPTSGELVAATHGRSLWVLDVTPLRQMTAAVLKDNVHLYQPNIRRRRAQVLRPEPAAWSADLLRAHAQSGVDLAQDHGSYRQTGRRTDGGNNARSAPRELGTHPGPQPPRPRRCPSSRAGNAWRGRPGSSRRCSQAWCGRCCRATATCSCSRAAAGDSGVA
ncbi:MAG: PDZ domain-containing protein [Planctomycetota bacterium]|nr:MAG: PDZ domain-containing protein [Planctomycetota bacterium]